MDWKLSSDGFYLTSRFGTTNDSSTYGHPTSCSYLQGHYNYYGCQYDVQTASCVSAQHDIPWVQGHVDYDYNTVITTVDSHMDGNVPVPEYFYVAGAQRFNCGSTLRVSNPANGRCVVVYVEDGGPGATYEDAGYGGRRILDASPAVVRYLQIEHWGWMNSDMVYVEWGLPGDVPGQACTICQSFPAAAGYEGMGKPFDVNNMMALSCRESTCGNGICNAGEDAGNCPADCASPECGNTVCEEGENPSSCPDDCWSPECGNGACEAGETCESCPLDCECDPTPTCDVSGHLGTGNQGDPCYEPSETWRCVFSPVQDTYVSQVCRDSIWQTYHQNPRDCTNCCAVYSIACEAAETTGGCGDGVCESGEDCGSCPADCECEPEPTCSVSGHLGTSDHGDPCFDTPESWRCVFSPVLDTYVSQVCRDSIWQTYHQNPRDCTNCCAVYSLACEAVETAGGCGNGVCESGEDCGSCPADCECEPEPTCSVSGHLGTSDHGDPCFDTPESWRCVFSPVQDTFVSQVCRDGIWQTYHRNPRDCTNCCAEYSIACEA